MAQKIKLYASKVDSVAQIKSIVDKYSSEYLGTPIVSKLEPVDFSLKTPPGLEQEQWVSQVRGSFIEYVLAHMFNAKGRDSEIKQIRGVSPELKEKIASHYEKTTKEGTAECISSILVCSLSHYLQFGSRRLDSSIINFYISYPTAVAGLDLDKLVLYTKPFAGHTITTGESVSSPTIGGSTDFIARKDSDILVLDCKYRTETPGVNQLLVYAALLFQRRGEKTTKLGLINPKKGETIIYQVKSSFYSTSDRMLDELASYKKKVNEETNQVPVISFLPDCPTSSAGPRKTTARSSAKKTASSSTPVPRGVRGVATSAKGLTPDTTRGANSRVPTPRIKKTRAIKVDESKMGWVEWIGYKLFNVKL
jgi:hypothetical protein